MTELRNHNENGDQNTSTGRKMTRKIEKMRDRKGKNMG
jgi:hypothetical protein